MRFVVAVVGQMTSDLTEGLFIFRMSYEKRWQKEFVLNISLHFVITVLFI